MKKLIFVSLVILALCGCTQPQIKIALADCLTVAAEVEAMEREKCGCVFTVDKYQNPYEPDKGKLDCSCPVADKIKVWREAGQQIYDSESYADNCQLMISISDIAYDWLVREYPDKPYRVFVALFRTRLAEYCGGVK